MTAPAVTAVIPTYRRPALLRRAIESAQRQSWPHLRIAVFDNASGDETEAVVAALAREDSRMVYHRHAANLGAVANFQYGMDAVATPYFSFLSDDDVLLPDFYACAMEALARHPEARFFCGQTLVWDPTHGRYRARPQRLWHSGLEPAGASAGRMIRDHFTWTGIVFDSTLRREAGPLLNQEIGDIPFQARAAALHPFVVSLTPHAVFTRHAGSASSELSVADYERCYEACKVWCTEPAALSEQVRSAIREAFDDLLVRSAAQRLRRSFRHGDWDELERAARLLEQREALGGRLRMIARVARLRSRRPTLAGAARRLLLLGYDRRSGRGRLPAAPDLDALVATYSNRSRENGGP